MATTVVQFNPSTLKAKYTAATSKAQTIGLGLCNNCGSSCYAIYSDTDCNACCFAAGQTPRYLCLTFSGMKRCSDDSAISTFYVCVEQSATDTCDYCGSTSIDGDSCAVHYSPRGGCYSTEALVYSATNIYFAGWTANNCDSPANDLLQSGGDENDSCDETYTLDVGCWHSPMTCGGTGDRTITAYDGSVAVCNPITGYNLVPC